MFRKGFTLVEIVVAVAISTILLAGTIGISVKAVNSLANEKSKGQSYSSLTDAISKLNSVRNAYPMATVVDVPNGYDFIVFTNSGQTAGVLVGVAYVGSGTVEHLLDPVANHSIYGEKVLVIQDITAIQTAAVIADHQAAYAISIREESVFRKLVVESLQATAYNVDRIVDVFLAVYVVPRPELEGQPKSSFPEFPVTFNLVL